MTAGGAFGPFKPGFGGMPPYLAGRQEEQHLFGDLLTVMENGEPLAADLVLYGPRGNGKTVLLRWLENEASTRRSIETVVLSPSETADPARLTNLLAPKSWWKRFAAQQIEVGGIAWRAEASGPRAQLGDVLAARARKTPLLVVVDEAHTLDLEAGRALVSACQIARAKDPFLLVLAGTPNLEGRLNAMDASFWGRAWTRRIGRLDESATEEALRRPFEAAGIRVDKGTLAKMVRLSHGYPYFIQLLGQEAWAEAVPPRGSGVLTAEAFAGAQARFEHRKRDYYRHRYLELEEDNLLQAGRSVAEAFARHPILDTESLRQAIEMANPAQDPSAVARTQRTLEDLGFIWGTSPDPGWEPGIASLMDYVREHASVA